VLTIHQLQVFVTVAELTSIRRAAERLTVSQPAVSASMAALRREVGVDLVAKHGRGIELTDAGRSLLRYAQLVLGLIDEAIDSIRFADGGPTRPVRIGVTTATASRIVGPVLVSSRTARPSLQFELDVANRTTIWQKLADRELDVAVTSRPPTTRGFTSLAVRADELVLVARPGLVWAGKVGDVTWLLREEGSGSRAATEEVMTRLGISPPCLQMGSNEIIQHGAEAGLGIALLPVDSVADAIRSRALVTVRTPATPLNRPLHVVARTGDPLGASTRQLVVDLVSADDRFTWTADGEALVAPDHASAGTR
jgi:LysR family transcriptional regulator, low CO2-responsive transcriptional regulator